MPYFDRKGRGLCRGARPGRPNRQTRPAQIRLSAKAGNVPWTFSVKIEGVIVEANTASRAATIGVDTTGNGKTDAIVQIGPAMRGTAIRDALDFVSFNDFTNQIDFAQFGKAFNHYVDRDVSREAAARTRSSDARSSSLGAYPLVLGAISRRW